MSKELIERLRADAESTDDIGLCAVAADRIEELERKVASRDAEVAELKKEVEEDSALRDRLAKILAEVAIALKGQEGALTRHSWHDLAQCAIDVVKERDQLRKDVEMLRDGMVAINTTGVMREAKWAGMSARDIARFTLAATEPKE